jgi:hypothetical protein
VPGANGIVVAVATVAAVGAVISYRYAVELVSCTARLIRELRLGHLRATGGASDTRAAVALVRTGGPAAGRGGLPIVLR